MVIEEDGKLYNIDDETGLVTEASLVDDIQDIQDEYRLKDRVEVVGRTGEIVSIVPSHYGLAFGVRFDDGEIDEFGESQMKHSSAAKTEFETPISEVLARFAAYTELPVYTNDEIAQKEEEAQWLKLRAKSLAANGDLELVDQNELGRIILITETDLNELKDLRNNSEESNAYTSKLRRYKIADEFSGYGAGLGLKGDASWLENALEDMEIAETTDNDLAARATEVVTSLSKSQLSDDDFMTLVASYQRDYLQMDEDQAKKFASYLSRARSERIKELPEVEKTASTEFNLDDATDLFI